MLQTDQTISSRKPTSKPADECEDVGKVEWSIPNQKKKRQLTKISFSSSQISHKKQCKKYSPKAANINRCQKRPKNVQDEAVQCGEGGRQSRSNRNLGWGRAGKGRITSTTVNYFRFCVSLAFCFFLVSIHDFSAAMLVLFNLRRPPLPTTTLCKPPVVWGKA